MNIFKAIVRGIDTLNEWIGHGVAWVTLGLVAVVFVDVVMRYLFNTSYVFAQELEWHLFAFIFLMGAGYTLLNDGHVRVDIIYQRLGLRAKAWINLVGVIFFLIPGCAMVVITSWKFTYNAWVVMEGSPDSGGIPYPIPNKGNHYRRFCPPPYPGGFFGVSQSASAARSGDRGRKRRGNILMEYLALWMFLALTILLMAGFPVAFTLLGISLIFGLIGFGWSFFDLLPLRIWGRMSNVTLMAVPLFVFMGVTLERSGLAEELLDTMGLLFGRLKGGLAVSVVVVGALLGASTGIVGATVVTMGLLAVPTMLRRGYQKEMATGTVSASGTLGQIIPPSIVLVLIGDIVGVSVGDIFMGAVLPGLLLICLYIIYILGAAYLRPKIAPPIPKAERDAISTETWPSEWAGPCSPLFLMVSVLGSIFAGIASPTEAAAVGAVGAILLTILNRKFSMKMLHQVMISTVRLTCMVFIILCGAAAFGLVFRGLNGDTLVREFLGSLADVYSKGAVLAIVMGVIFIIGFFLDFIEITFIHVPVLAPIMLEFGFDPVWFCILLAVNLQTSFMTPPFGFSLFYLKAVTPPEVTTGDIYRGIIPFVVFQLIGLGIVAFYPELATWLPRVVFGD
ncbi:MAG: TRAP transporter large permease subunit [Deltaproteobacteria bacterium]|nr:TRAP transporter large permease subunit [Deltaproteobacteria bacterium]